METRQIKTSYSTTAGTAYITFDNVKVPVENTLGEEGGGIFVILRFDMFSLCSVRHHDTSTATSTMSVGSCVVHLLGVSVWLVRTSIYHN